jgi:hypothetical protein
VKLIVYRKNRDRIIPKVIDDEALPIAGLEDFWADPRQGVLAVAPLLSGSEPSSPPHRK